jgi:hypothetical protein
MELGFLVDLVALHLVDRQLPEPSFCARAILLEDFHNPADRLAIQRFLCRHFDEMWAVEESLRTRAGVFEAQAVMQAYYAEIIRDKSCFTNVRATLPATYLTSRKAPRPPRAFC